MCSYTSINGTPSCSNDYILNEMMRKRWGAEHAFVSTDCGAVLNMMVSRNDFEDFNSLNINSAKTTSRLQRSKLFCAGTGVARATPWRFQACSDI
eukprot:COSAG02_NODE_3131_length_7311_cov_11.071131_7_plen_95_part_00